MKSAISLLASLACALILLAGCGAEQPGADTSTITDQELAERVETALLSAADLPEGLLVQASDGVVTISGALACEDCGGNRTPGTTGTIQQSLGTVVRAVPGVTEVQFQLDYANE